MAGRKEAETFPDSAPVPKHVTATSHIYEEERPAPEEVLVSGGKREDVELGGNYRDMQSALDVDYPDDPTALPAALSGRLVCLSFEDD